MAVDVMAEYRLDKFLALNGVGTRSQVKELIRKGLIRINGEAAKKPEQKIDPQKDQITAEGRILNFSETVYYMLHKPAGVITATDDKRHQTVMDLLEEKRTDLFPVGRLDIDTEGLLLITNDGETGHRLLSPKRHVDKTYYVETDSPIPSDAGERFAAGLDLGDFTSMPAHFELLSPNSGKLTIHEGKFHQVKRMFEAVGTTVVYLKRLTMGPLVLDETLEKGAYRKLTETEVEAIRTI